MKTILFSNYDLEPYEEEAKYNVGESEVEDFANELMKDEWNDIYSNLLNILRHKNCIFYGSMGLWDGNCDGGKIGDFETLWQEVLEDCWYWELAFEDKELKLKCSHHDGTNYFTIKVVTNEGAEYYNKWNFWEVDDDLDEREVFNKIIKNYTEDIAI